MMEQTGAVDARFCCMVAWKATIGRRTHCCTVVARRWEVARARQPCYRHVTERSPDRTRPAPRPSPTLIEHKFVIESAHYGKPTAPDGFRMGSWRPLCRAYKDAPARGDCRNMKRCFGLLFLLFAVIPAAASARLIADAPLGQGLTLDYYVSAPPGPNYTQIVIAVHGYPRDADRTYDAALNAARNAGRGADTLIVAPIYQVPASEADKCHFRGVPGASPDNALWHCNNWQPGALALNGEVTSFQAMDRLVDTLLQRYPGVRTVTIAGFSAGGQFVQHYIGFARPSTGSAVLRYIVADPSEFVYFDPDRPVKDVASCPRYNDWKYGEDKLPTYLGRDAAAARVTYAKANVHYLEGALDTGTGPGTSYRLLEKNCAAELQGPYRLERGENYAAYDKAKLAYGAHRLTIVPGCAHSVDCVFSSSAAAPALFDGR
jgi:hypothetical protein